MYRGDVRELVLGESTVDRGLHDTPRILPVYSVLLVDGQFRLYRETGPRV